MDGRDYVSEGPEVGREIGVCPLLPQPPQADLNFLAFRSGLKFDSSGLYVRLHSIGEKNILTIISPSTRRRDSRLTFPRSEKEIFDIIGIPWVKPTLRNTDA